MEYVEHFMHKMTLYTQTGLVLGKNLFVTFEDKDHPLLTQSIKGIIEQLI